MRKHKRALLGYTLLSVGLAAAPMIQPTPSQAAPKQVSPVQVWLTDVGSNQWVAKQEDVSFKAQQPTSPLTIKVDENVKYQEITGYGAALTDTSAWLINQLPTDSKNTLMQNLFDPSKGIGLNMVRSPMGATDFNVGGNYSYNDMPAGQTDPTLAKFSIEHDMPYIIPQLKQALALNPDLKVTSTPWSPPGWMKTSGSMIGGTLLDQYSPALANYFVKYIQAYGKAGVPISYVTPQNEPLNAPSWPGMALTPGQQTKLIQQLGQAFEANNISTKILGWDHNWDVPSYPESIYNDPATADYAVGAGFHIYSGTPTYQTLAHNDYPGKEIYLTEATGGVWQANNQVAFHDALNTWILDATRNYSNGTMLWNIALDPDMGPLNSDTNGIGMCRGLVTIDPKSGAITYNPEYYALAQVTKFVKPGAHRIYSNTFGDGNVNNVAFQNPDGSKVLVAYNDSNAEQTISVADGSQSFDYKLNAGNAATFVYSLPKNADKGNAKAADGGRAATDPTYDFAFKSGSESQTITYDPKLLPLQNSVTAGDKLTTYSLPVGASILAPGKELNRSGWTLTSSPNEPGNPPTNAIDGDPSTRWRTAGKMKSGDGFEINLGSPTSFSQITLDNTADNAFDSVFQYQVYVSNDGVNWGSAVTNGNGALGKTTITMSPQKAQYIRVVSTAPSFFFRWSIGEINVYGAPEGTGSIQAPTAVSKGLQLQSWTSQDGANVSVVYNGTKASQSFPVSADSKYTYTLPSGTSAMFTTKTLPKDPAPALDGVAPAQGIPGYKFKITGSHFGATQGLGTVYFGGTNAKIESWSDTTISAYVPNDLPSGAYTVSVNGAWGQPAGESTFTVNGLGTPLPKTGWTATASHSNQSPGDAIANMVDGDTDTRYSSGTGQASGMSIQLDMGQAQTFDTVTLDSGSSMGDYARRADVEVSSDGNNWTKVASLVADGQQIQAVSFPTQTARYIKVINTGSAGNWWSIAEFSVYAGGTVPPVDGGGSTNPAYGTPLSRTGWTPTASNTSPWPNDALEKMLDGDAASRYSSGASQTVGMWVQVDMGQAQTFDKVVLDSGTSIGDFASSADVEVSSDGTNWTKVASIVSDGQQIQVASFETQTARYIKVINTGNSGRWWSIAEFNAYA
ncbi:O-glycosyl hydrolase [Arthrobacter sp. 1088]|uniref:discoidin domain-containing protein n=1 Tax=Arthrobacter sp. 1088 TaxID=2817768 RepID=UPI002862C539|nr:discoidin domain-containing protein [Arthrobacter sp. 1088]MDR6688259.1 O-glycosyl hydrolase [Arthrobacter sp. 1088]